MKIRDSHAIINGDKTEYEMPSGGLDIIDADGRSLFCISRIDGGISVSAVGRVRVGKDRAIHDEGIMIHPCTSNVVEITRRKEK